MKKKNINNIMISLTFFGIPISAIYANGIEQFHSNMGSDCKNNSNEIERTKEKNNNDSAILEKVEIVGLKKQYVEGETLKLSIKTIFSNDNYNESRINYKWRISGNYVDYNETTKDIKFIVKRSFNNAYVTATAYYEGQEQTTKTDMLWVVENKTTISSSEILGIKPSYNIGSTLNCSLLYNTSDNTNILEPTKYYWEKYENGNWTQVGDSKILSCTIDESWINSKLRLRFIFNDDEYCTPEYYINASLIQNVIIDGFKNEYEFNQSMHLKARVILSNGQTNTEQVGYKWEISKQNKSRQQEWQTISNSDTLKIDKLDDSYLGCSIRFTPIFNGQEITQKVVPITNDLKLVTSNQGNANNFKTNSNNLTIILLSVFSSVFVIIIILLIIFFIRRSKKKRNKKSLIKYNAKPQRKNISYTLINDKTQSNYNNPKTKLNNNQYYVQKPIPNNQHNPQVNKNNKNI